MNIDFNNLVLVIVLSLQLFKNDEINEKLKADAYGLSPIFIINPKKIKTYYTASLKKTNKITRRIYNGNKSDE